ncbi:MAG: hypothetical protein Q7T18_02785, partial [Sedimentisphaerales bacterium]|nr:hypothetical protein [Sedimentisphaerales bacterium]
WLGIALTTLVFSPVIIYNLMMYKTTGHFDFQFSYIFGQNPEVWKSAPGKEAMPTYAARLGYFFPYLFKTSSLTMLILTAISLPFLFRKKKWFVVFAIFWMLVLLARIGPTYRFLTMLTPFLILSIGALADRFFDPLKKKGYVLPAILLTLVLLWETLYTMNSVITNYPTGSYPLAFSHVRYDNYNWGYNALADYFDKELAGKYPKLTFGSRYQFLEKIGADATEKARRAGAQPFPVLIIYDGNIVSSAQLWIFDRLQIYHGWPVMTAGEYLADLAQNGADYFRDVGISTTYFAAPTGYVPLKTESLGGALTNKGTQLEQLLAKKGVTPVLIQNLRGE